MFFPTDHFIIILDLEAALIANFCNYNQLRYVRIYPRFPKVPGPEYPKQVDAETCTCPYFWKHPEIRRVKRRLGPDSSATISY